MKVFLVLLKKEFLEQIRLKKLLIIVVLFLFAAIGSPIFAKLMPEILRSMESSNLAIDISDPTYLDSVDQFIKNLSQIVIFVLILVSAGTIADEKTKKTLELLLVKPVSKIKFILAKYVSFYLSIIVTYIISSLIFYFYTVSVFRGFNFNNFIYIDFIVLLYILLIVSITICASAFFRSSLLASAVGFLGLIFFSTFSNIFTDLNDYAPNYIIYHYKEILVSGWQNDFILSIVISLILIIFLVIMAAFIFKRQEILN